MKKLKKKKETKYRINEQIMTHIQFKYDIRIYKLERLCFFSLSISILHSRQINNDQDNMADVIVMTSTLWS